MASLQSAPEILAPVGGEEQLLAAVRCGANAVYLGGKNFNARRNAENFAEADLQKAVSYCHARNVKVYITVNTLILDSELGMLEEEADRIASAGADAVIIQDMAVLRLFASRYPTLKRHASTQTAVHNVDGARFLQDIGFDSIVLARELSLGEMESICSAVTIPTEAFVHGAHCMSVSGACTLSAMLGGRSGNRGLCAQPCRLDWTCGEKRYALSLKDLSLISHLSDMANAGVRSFKIEGRMKRPEYVAAAVTACRQSLTGKPFDEETLRAAFSRSGFTDGYLTGKRNAEMFGYRTKEDVTDMGSVQKALAALYKNETPLVPVDLSFELDEHAARLSVSDGITEASTESGAPELAIHRALDETSARQNLEKTGGTPFFVRSFTAKIAEGYALSAAALNALRREALEKLLEVRSQVQPHLRQPFEWEPSSRRVLLPEQPALWARFYDERQMKSAEPFEKILLPAERITVETIRRFGGKLAAQLPTLLFPEDEPAFDEHLGALAKEGLTEVWTNNIYGVALGKRLGLTVNGGFGLNVTNTQSLLFYETQGLSSLTVSFELAMAKIKALGGIIPRGVVSYGNVPLMHLRNCPVRAAIGCKACAKSGSLTDRLQISFPVECEEMRSADLLNSVPIDLAGRSLGGLDFQLLYFTRESADEVAEITTRFLSAQKTDKPHTGGLYYRELL
ncbi:MAG TPA: U32 family peptidase [Feifaniaceae bacterium]|nr:U32 family peptidase [Feifaniaceae bacterium]